MISKETTAIISISNNGIILNPRSNNKEQIPYSDVSKIHISVHQRQFVLKIFLISYFIFTLFCLNYLNLELSVFSIVIFTINFLVMNSLDFKSYRLQIVLKNNMIIEKRIPKKLKYEFISIVNEVRGNLNLEPTVVL
ncbi:hypothetical protein [Flavobacterium ammonificans]|jgi:hypothetical protein|uniref:hypothetical protein n=1 Tax=Flavobacterium ammonificans TaxID=1751056 RepID=UPI001E5C0C6F|nr:hypothetical protein [Flavobacterium ammonificans]